MKVSELNGALLDYWVAKAEGKDSPWFKNEVFGCVVKGKRYSPSTDWSQGGPIIEREKIMLVPPSEDFDGELWGASSADESIMVTGESLLIAAMRCYVASKFGDTVDDSQAD